MRLHQTLIHQSVDLQVIDQCQTKQTDLINVLNSFSATVGCGLTFGPGELDSPSEGVSESFDIHTHMYSMYAIIGSCTSHSIENSGFGEMEKACCYFQRCVKTMSFKVPKRF